MTIIHAAQALTPQGWRRNVRLHVRNGRIAMIETDIAPQAGDELHAILVPAMANVHSHASSAAWPGSPSCAAAPRTISGAGAR